MMQVNKIVLQNFTFESKNPTILAISFHRNVYSSSIHTNHPTLHTCVQYTVCSYAFSIKRKIEHRVSIIQNSIMSSSVEWIYIQPRSLRIESTAIVFFIFIFSLRLCPSKKYSPYHMTLPLRALHIRNFESLFLPSVYNIRGGRNNTKTKEHKIWGCDPKRGGMYTKPLLVMRKTKKPWV